MTRIAMVALCSTLALSACGFGFGFRQAAAPAVGPDGNAVPVAYRITPADEAAIPNRVLGNVNGLRAGSGAPPLMLNPQLNAAATAHARDMAAQNRAWHFGSDGSSPIERVRNAGYAGRLVGENISETYENDTATLSAWMQTRDTRDVIMDPTARSLGIGWYQEPSSKVWWVLLAGS